MKQLNVHEAKTHLSRVLAQVQAGESFVIARNGRPVAKLVPWAERRRLPRVFGTAKSRVTLTAGWNAPLPEKILGEF